MTGQPIYAVDGVPLSQHAFNVVDVVTDILPPLRGSDRELAGVPGQVHRPRTPDSRTRTLGMHIIGCDFGGTTRAQWIANCQQHFRTVQRLLNPDSGAEFVLARSWTDDLGDHTAEAHGIATGMDRAWINEWSLKLTVDVLLADPYFYGAEQSRPISRGTTVTIDNAGDTATTAVCIDFAGQLGSPELTNRTADPSVIVKVGATIAASDTVTVDVEQGIVTRASDSANLIGALTHSGARHWMGLQRGQNRLTFSAASGDGTATIRWRERWH